MTLGMRENGPEDWQVQNLMTVVFWESCLTFLSPSFLLRKIRELDYVISKTPNISKTL